MKTKFVTAALGVALLLPGYTHAAGLDGLYFRMRMSFGTISQDHWWFLADGRYLNSAPGGGLDPAVFEANCQKFPAGCGTYQVQGDKIHLAPRKGQPFSFTFKALADSNLELDGLFTKHVDKFGNNVKLDGHYSWSGGASGGGTAVSASMGYQFNPDGSFTTSSAAGVSAGKLGASSRAAGAGSYRLSGNLLELTSGGTAIAHTAYPYALGKGDIRLNIDGEMFKRDR